jgi:hypothetical protein
MLAALNRDRLVGNFVAAYVAEYDRRGILGGTDRDRELAETVGREVVLAMIHQTQQALPRFYGTKKRTVLKDEEKQAIDAFFRELMAALGRAWDWNGDEQRQFRRDLDLYAEFQSRLEKAAKTQKKGKPLQKEDPPFVGRVALLLDPSMLEQARRAARKFYGDVEKLGQKLLKQTLSPGR